MARDNVPEELQYLRKRARRRLVGAVALVVFSLTVLWTVLDSQPPANLMAQHPVEIIASAPSSGVASDAVVMAPDVASDAAVAVQPALTPAASGPAIAANVTPAPVATGPTHASTLLPGKLVRNGAGDEEPAPHAKPTPKPTPVKVAAAKPTPAPAHDKPAARDKTPGALDPERILNGMDDTAPAAAAAAKKDDSSPRHYVQLGAYSDAEKAHQTVSKLKAAGMPAYAEKVTTDNGTLTRVRVGPVLASEAYSISKKLSALGYQGQVISK